MIIRPNLTKQMAQLILGQAWIKRSIQCYECPGAVLKTEKTLVYNQVSLFLRHQFQMAVHRRASPLRPKAQPISFLYWLLMLLLMASIRLVWVVLLLLVCEPLSKLEALLQRRSAMTCFWHCDEPK